MKIPPLYTFVKVFYRQGEGEGEGWGLCKEVGFWDGETFNRLDWTSLKTFHPQKLKFVEGWEEIT